MEEDFKPAKQKFRLKPPKSTIAHIYRTKTALGGLFDKMQEEGFTYKEHKKGRFMTANKASPENQRLTQASLHNQDIRQRLGASIDQVWNTHLPPSDDDSSQLDKVGSEQAMAIVHEVLKQTCG